MSCKCGIGPPDLITHGVNELTILSNVDTTEISS
jgi:hypothetical protein